MLLFLKNINNGNIFYLIEKDKFLVGRKDCEFLIQDDQSISRKHAIIHLKENKVTVEDLGSKYKTLYKGEALTPNTETELAVGDNIHFGVSHSLYSLQKYEFVTTGTLLKGNVKAKLVSDLSKIKGKYVDQWTSDCTHLTVEEITLTIKFLHALLDEKPVVLPTYWSKFAERIQKNLPPPNIDHYNNPPIAELLLNKNDLSLNPERKCLFKGKLFVFPKEKEKKQMESIVKKAGGASISWEKDPIPLKDIEKSPKEFIIIQSSDMTYDSDLNQVVKTFSKQGKRTIPLKEIAMSILHCSCEKDCNPNFNRVEHVFPLSKPLVPTQSNALAADSESQQFTIKVEEKEELVIPDTFESQLDKSKPCKIFAESEIVFVNEGNDNQSMKRTNKEKLEETPLKKIKIDSDSEVDVKEETMTKKKRLKQEKTKEEDGNHDVFICKSISPKKRVMEESTSDNQSLFFNKNKRSNTDLNSPSKSHPFKRTKKDSDNTVHVNKENPFLMSMGTKKRSNDDLSEPSTSKKKKSNIFSSTKVENISHNLSGASKISRINKDLTNSTWISKNTSYIDSSEHENVEGSFDIELKKFIEQFKNTVIVEIMEKTPPKQKILRDNVQDFCEGKVNFKIFKKVMPLRPQKKIIGKLNLTTMGSADMSEIADSRREIFPNSDDEAEQSLRVKKKKPKKFII